MEAHEDGTGTDAALSEALGALANPVRLALLRQLRTPKPLKDIQVRPSDGAFRASSPDRPIARQSVKEHLDRLLEAGVVEAREVELDGRDTVEYVLNHQALFSLSEAFRDLARLRPSQEPGGDTIHAAPRAPAPAPPPLRGPCLVLVHGLEEGRTFPLPPPASGRRQWVIGRRRGCDVSLDFDPHVSAENSVVAFEAGAYVLQDLPDNRNGTTLNFRALPRGGSAALAPGDLVGVGRVILAFRA